MSKYTVSFDEMFKDFCARMVVETGKCSEEDLKIYSEDFKVRIKKAMQDAKFSIVKDEDSK